MGAPCAMAGAANAVPTAAAAVLFKKLRLSISPVLPIVAARLSQPDDTQATRQRSVCCRWNEVCRARPRRQGRPLPPPRALAGEGRVDSGREARAGEGGAVRGSAPPLLPFARRRKERICAGGARPP